MEDLSQLIARLRKELARARDSRDRIEDAGQSSSFGGVSFANVAYSAILTRIKQLERELYRAEALAEGIDIDPDVRVTRISQW
jgi:hypothetical protein